MDHKDIESINIEKTDKMLTLIDGVEYRGKINIVAKPGTMDLEGLGMVIPKYITLKELVNKYTDVDADPIIFQIDDSVIDEDFTTYKVDENFILQIITSKVKTSAGSTHVNLIKIITKTKANIEKANTIRIRGVENFEKLNQD